MARTQDLAALAERQRSRQLSTPKKEVCLPKFLRMYAQCGNVLASCRAAGIDRHTYYNWRAEDAAFDEACRHAGEDAADSLEEAGWQRARETSDTLLIFFLKALRPEKYRDRHLVEVLKRYEEMSDDELNEHLARRLSQMAAVGESGPALAPGADESGD